MRYRNGFALGLVVLMMVAFMGAAPATAAEQFISGGLQIHAFNFQSKADVEYEIPDGKFAIGGQDIGGTKIDGDVDYKTDTTIGFALGYTYISPEDWFLGGELIFANYKGEFKGDLKGDFKGNDIKYDVKSDAEIKSTRIGALGGYYFKPKPLRPYVMGGLGLNLNELDIEDVDKESATHFSISAGGGADYFTGNWVLGANLRLDYYLAEEYEVEDFTVTMNRIPVLLTARVGYVF